MKRSEMLEIACLLLETEASDLIEVLCDRNGFMGTHFCGEDIAMRYKELHGVDPTQGQIELIKEQRSWRDIKDAMIEAGWISISEAISEAREEDEKEDA